MARPILAVDFTRDSRLATRDSLSGDPMQTCSHIKADGALCRAIPMKNKTRCYFHQQTQTRQRQVRNNRMLPMPVIEDVPSIQLALMDVLNRLTQGTIEARNAGLILYALQIASSNLRTGRFTSKGWQDYQSKNAQLVRTEEVEERSQSASELLVQMLTARKEECIAQGPDPDLAREERIPFINASVAQPPPSAAAVRGIPRTPSSANVARAPRTPPSASLWFCCHPEQRLPQADSLWASPWKRWASAQRLRA
jgi:hypothetical protein